MEIKYSFEKQSAIVTRLIGQSVLWLLLILLIFFTIVTFAAFENTKIYSLGFPIYKTVIPFVYWRCILQQKQHIKLISLKLKYIKIHN